MMQRIKEDGGGIRAGEVIRIQARKTPHEFLLAAQECEHPIGKFGPYRNVFLDTAKRTMESAPQCTIDHRQRELAKWEVVLESLRDQEAKLHAALPGQVEQVMR